MGVADQKFGFVSSMGGGVLAWAEPSAADVRHGGGERTLALRSRSASRRERRGVGLVRDFGPGAAGGLQAIENRLAFINAEFGGVKRRGKNAWARSPHVEGLRRFRFVIRPARLGCTRREFIRRHAECAVD